MTTTQPGGPLVSVVMPSYNHGGFVRPAIDSVLAQTVRDIELIVVDDGSQDASPAILSGLQDPRLRIRLLERNYGACHAMNTALQMSTGKFIAVCNSDDVWKPDKLRRQLEVLDKLPAVAAIFSDVEWINSEGKKLADSALPPFASVFRQQNRSRWSWLRSLLETGNCLCHPSILIRREAYELVGPYDNRLRQLPDLDMWTRIVQHFDIFVMSDRLLSFRIHDRNTSTPSPETSQRDLHERRFILSKVMDRISPDNFVRAFGLKGIDLSDALDLQIERALYLTSYKGRYIGIFRELGLDLLYALLDDPNGQYRLQEKFGFGVIDFQRELGNCPSWVDVPTGAAGDGYALTHIRSVDLVKLVASRVRNRAGAEIRKAFRRD